jgi:anaphase-promoting complex subunit 4
MPYSLALHASHKHSSLHSLLYKSDSVLVGGLYYIPMDLRFISTDSEYIGLLASRSTALQNLLRYIDQVQISMKEMWNASQELPGRFLSFINETLAEKDGWSIEQALYHSVVTGHTYPEVKEWLIDTVGERVRFECTFELIQLI